MESISLPIKYVKNNFEDFIFYKEMLLYYFENAQDTPSSNISKSDWGFSTDFNRAWVKWIYPCLSYNLINLTKNMGYSGLSLTEIWFQQYNQNSHHSWHVHGGHYTGAFYVELPEGTPKTQLKFGEEIIEIDAKEGEIVIFPSFVVHSSPPNNSPHRKSIISFNLNLLDNFNGLNEYITK